MPETYAKAYEIFKRTREERGLSLSDAANALHLTVTMIEQIEAGEFVHRHLAPVFIRGYVRSYAKYLNLPENIVDEMVSPLSIKNPIKTAEKSKPAYTIRNGKQPAKQSVYNSKKMLSYLLVVALLIIIASFWHGTNKPEAVPQTTPPTEQSQNTITEPASEAIENAITPSEPEENATLQSEETPVTPSTEKTPETTLPPPVVETPPPAPVVVVAPPVAQKAPTPPKVTPAEPTQPEVVDAQETT